MMRSRNALFVFAVVAGAVVNAVVAIAAEETAGSLAQQAGAKFQKNCMSCHQPPDLRFETDRAWLSQIMRTA